MVVVVVVEVAVGVEVKVGAVKVRVGWPPGIRAASGEVGERSDRWKT